MLDNRECVQAGKEFAKLHGDEAWAKLKEAWGITSVKPGVREVFIAGLSMGFVEALKMVRDAAATERKAGDA